MRLNFIKNYFFEIWLITLLAILLTLVLSSFFLYKSFESSMIDNLNKINNQFLSETKRINEYFNKMVKLSGMELYFEPSIQKLIYQEDLGNFDILTGIRRIDSIHSMAMHYHSIYVYNAKKGYIYSTSNFISNHLERFYDLDLKDLLHSDGDVRKLFPIPRMIRSEQEEEFVYSYVFHGNRDVTQGALIININLDWLKQIVEAADGESVLYIVDGNKRVVYHSEFSYLLRDVSNEAFIEQIFSSDVLGGYFVSLVADEEFFVMYTVSEDQELYFIRLYPYSLIMGNIEGMKRQTVKLLVAFIVFGFVVAFFLSRRIYNPIGRLLVSLEKFGGKKEQDDFGYLASTIDNMLTKTSTLETATEVYLGELRMEVLKNVLEGSFFGKSDLLSIFKEYAIPFDPKNPFSLIMVYGELPQNYSLPPQQRVVIIPIREVTVLLSQKTTPHQQKKAVEQLRDSGATFIAWGRVDSGEKLSKAYSAMLDFMNYRTFHEPGHIVELGTISELEEDYRYPTHIEKQIIQCLQSGDAQKALDHYHKMLQTISLYRYDHFRFSVKRLYVSIQILIKELQDQGSFVGYVDPGIDGFENFLKRMNNISELNHFFYQLFQYFPEEMEKRRLQRHQIVAEEVERLIQKQYADPNLSLQGISEQINLSPSYVSRIFKSINNISVGDYLNNYRIEKAKKLFLKNLTVKETAAKVGFVNENYFYTLFKKKTSMTPSQYKQHHK